MAGAETVKEMQERDAGLDSAQVGHSRQIGGLLDAAAGEHGKARLAAVHHVGMIAEDGKRMGSHGTGCHMQHTGQTLTRDTVHRRDHQHQALRRGKAGGQRTGLQGAVAGTAGAGLGLHFHQTDRLAENVLAALGRPLIRMLRHRAGRRNGIDGSYFRKGICHICRRFVSVADLHKLTHSLFLLFIPGTIPPAHNRENAQIYNIIW